MPDKEVKQIKDLFDHNYIGHFCNYIFKVDSEIFWRNFNKNRTSLIQNLNQDAYEKIRSSSFIEGLTPNKSPLLGIEDYQKALYNFENRHLLHKHYLLAKNNLSREQILFVSKLIFEQDINVFVESLKARCNNITDDNIRYFAILDLLSACILYSRLFIQNKNTMEGIFLKYCMSLSGTEYFSIDKALKTSFKGLIYEFNKDSALPGKELSKRYERLLDIIKKLDEVSFFEQIKKTERIKLAKNNNIEVDDFVKFLAEEPKHYISKKYSKTLTLNYLECMYGIKRNTLKKRIERGVIKQKIIDECNEMSEVDNLILNLGHLDQEDKNKKIKSILKAIEKARFEE